MESLIGRETLTLQHTDTTYGKHALGESLRLPALIDILRLLNATACYRHNLVNKRGSLHTLGKDHRIAGTQQSSIGELARCLTLDV